jgi:hypothetical protein
MRRTTISSWRTLFWGRGFILLFALAGSVPLVVLLRGGENFDWFGGPPPWYAPLAIAAFVGVVLAFVHKVVGHIRPVAVGDGHVYVSRWIGEDVFPLSAVTAVYFDRDTSIGGQSPLRMEITTAGRTIAFAFLIVEHLDAGDIEEMTGFEVGDTSDSSGGNAA